MTRHWQLIENASLQARNTFGVHARTPWLLKLDDAVALPEALALPQLQGVAPLVLGSGSNILFAGDAPVPVLVLTAAAIGLLAERDGIASIRVDAGVPWHDLVQWTLEQGLMGFENLALIPGTTGAAPIQNIGAYGTEVGEFITCVEVFDREAGAMARIGHEQCGFAYRDSVFKRGGGRYVVVAVEFALPRQRALRVGYAGIGEELVSMGVTRPTFRDVAAAVIRLRRRKLPDPQVIGNAGSFFKNPIVDAAVAEQLQAQFPRLPVYPGARAGTRKLSAAWLIEACGWKGYREGDAGVAASHALVLVNHGGASGAQLLALARRIADSVHERFGVALEPEPRIVGGIW